MKKSLCLLLPIMSGIFAGLILVEIIIRTTIAVPWPEKFPLSRVRPDPDIGWTMVPGDIHYTYEALVKINSLGFRGPEIAKIKTNGYRILAIGDSHVYGQGLDNKELATTKLQHSLNEHQNGCFFNVINMGVRAYSINNELAMLKKNGLPLSPDHVLWFFFIDDFSESNIQRWYGRFADNDWYMFDLLNKPTQKVVWYWKFRQIARQSALLMWLQDIISIISNKENFEYKLLNGIKDDDIQLRIRFVKQNLDNLKRLSEINGFSLTLVLIPEASQLINEYPKNLYQNILKPYATEKNIDILDLRPFLQKYYEEKKQLPLIPFDGHYNAEGHSVIANAIVKHLISLPLRCK
jgi:lysophospholipase L1-like esterase